MGLLGKKVLGRRIHPETMVGKEYLRIVWRKNEHHREKIEKMFGKFYGMEEKCLLGNMKFDGQKQLRT